MRTTLENIVDLAPNEIFVFGSNTLGRHLGGAAKLAYEKFGAEYGVGEGRTGKCYAFPTLDGNFQQRTADEMIASTRMFKDVANFFPDLTFLLTRVGTGIAGFLEEDMIALFKDCPPNVIKPEGWN